MAHKHEITSLEETFDFNQTLKRKLIIATLVGVALVALGAYLIKMGWSPNLIGAPETAAEADPHGATLTSRIIANIWMNSIYFIGIAITGVFFLAYSYVARAGWAVSIERVAEAFPAFMVVPAAIMLILFLIPDTRHIIFHWTHVGITDPASQNYDAVIAGKEWFLNFPFFLVRMVIYFVVWYYLWRQIRKYSILQDEYGGLEYYQKNINYSKVFLLFFAVTSSTAAWDLSMSVDPHWFSTMFGWYHLSSWHVAGLAAMTLVIIKLIESGYLKEVQMSVIHDLAKLIFGFSIFWAYVWFSQYLLIFYAHLPEETVYFWERLYGYDKRYYFPFLASIVLNFVFPFLILMARGSKRNFSLVKLGSVLVLVGHWFDFYQMLMPGIAKDQGGLGIIEIGTTMVFTALFIYFLANELSKTSLYKKNHPFMEESLVHDI